MSEPTVSVILPFYRNPLVVEAVESILGQTFEDFELIAIDDCSGNGVADLVRGISDPRFRLVERETNGGENATRNHGVSLARGRYVAFQDHDDISYPGRLATQVAFLDSHPEVLGCGTACHYGEERVLHTAPETMRDMWWDMCFNNHVMFPTVMARTEVARRQPFGDLVATDDYRWLYEVMKEGDFVNLPDVTFHYRMQASSLSMAKADLQMKNLDIYRAKFTELATGVACGERETRWLRWLGTPRFEAWDSPGEIREACALLARMLEGYQRLHPGSMERARKDCLGRLRFACTVSARHGMPVHAAYAEHARAWGAGLDASSLKLAAKCLLASTGLLASRSGR